MSNLIDAHDAVSDVECLLETLFDALAVDEDANENCRSTVRITLEKLSALDKLLVAALADARAGLVAA